MEEKIIQFIKDNPYADGIDIALGLEIYIEESYRLLSKLITSNIITKHYNGMSTYFTIN